MKDAIVKLLVYKAEVWKVQKYPEAAALLVYSSPADSALLRQLQHFAPSNMIDALQLMSGGYGSLAAIRAYALRSLHTCPPEQVICVGQMA